MATNEQYASLNSTYLISGLPSGDMAVTDSHQIGNDSLLLSYKTEAVQTKNQSEVTRKQPSVQLLWKETVSLTYEGPILAHIDTGKLKHGDIHIFCDESKLQVIGSWPSIENFRQCFMIEAKQVIESLQANEASAPQQTTTRAAAAPHKAPVGNIHMSSLSGDVLALMKKCSVYQNDHLTYDIEGGAITIECPGDDEAATTIAEEFQTQYRQLMMGGKLKEQAFSIPSTYSNEQIQQLLNKSNSEYSQSIFKFVQENNTIKCLSMSARQMTHIKAKFMKQSSTTTKTTSQDTPTCISFMTAQGRRMTLKKANIVEEAVDAIVNAANEALDHAGGVALAINKASNGAVQQQSTTLIQQCGRLEVGQAVFTRAGGALKCKYVIHTVGPELKKHGNQSKNLLEAACVDAMQEAEKLQIFSLALPPISTGIFAVPIDVAAKTIINAVSTYTCQQDGLLNDVRIVIIDSKTFEAFKPYFMDAKAAIEGPIVTQPKHSAPPHTVPITYQHSNSWPSNDGSSDDPQHGKEHNSAGEDKCPICCEAYKEKVTTACNHSYCSKCIEKALKYSPYCPLCNTPLRKITGNQPHGTMKDEVLNHVELPGYKNYSTIKITYCIPNGMQQKEHPNPGKWFTGTTRFAYLPNTREGREVLQKLKKAFDAKLIFTVGTSVSSGETDTVIWNDIHHKTNIHGGPSQYGYPDSGYLQRITEELKQKGIV